MTEPGGETFTADARHAALASPTRRSILAALRSAGSPRDAHALSRDLGLHVTTVRFHLERLAGAGLVRVEPSAGGRRGRPRLLYSATGHENRDGRAQIQLIETLAAALGEREGDQHQMEAIWVPVGAPPCFGGQCRRVRDRSWSAHCLMPVRSPIEVGGRS